MPIQMKNVASLQTDLPDTYDMKTQQLYTSGARAVESSLLDKVGRGMIFHGPRALTPQDLFENKELPSMPSGVKQAPDTKTLPDPAMLFQTRKKITDLKQEPEATWGEEGAPRTATPQGVHNPMNKPPTSYARQKPIHLRRRAPAAKADAPTKANSARRPVNLQKNTTAEQPQQRRPTSIVDAERMANEMLRDGNFTRLGENLGIRA